MGMLIDASELEGRAHTHTDTHTHGRVFVSRTSFGRVVVIDVAAGGGGGQTAVERAPCLNFRECTQRIAKIRGSRDVHSV